MNTQNPQGVPVAAYPAENAPTYSQIINDADHASEPFIDDNTPPGHFGVTVTNLGGTQTYWFPGNPEDPQTRVVARTQTVNGHATHYVGGSFLGGTMVALNTDPPPTLVAAHAIATDPTKHTHGGLAAVRAALDAAAPAHADQDGWLWADEALNHIRNGNNTDALWQKVADNIAALTIRA